MKRRFDFSPDEAVEECRYCGGDHPARDHDADLIGTVDGCEWCNGTGVEPDRTRRRRPADG